MIPADVPIALLIPRTAPRWEAGDRQIVLAVDHRFALSP